MSIYINVLTGAIDRDSLDPGGWIRDEHWDEQRQRYIDMCIDAARKRYPNAEVDTAEGNGIETVQVLTDDPSLTEQMTDTLLDDFGDAYERWTETTPSDAQYPE